MSAIHAERDYVIEEDFMKAVRKVADAKKLESMFILLFRKSSLNCTNSLFAAKLNYEKI